MSESRGYAKNPALLPDTTLGGHGASHTMASDGHNDEEAADDTSSLTIQGFWMNHGCQWQEDHNEVNCAKAPYESQNTGLVMSDNMNSSRKPNLPDNMDNESTQSTTAKKAKRTAMKPPSSRVRKAPENPVAEGAPIANTLDELSKADQCLWEMRKAGKTFPEIMPHYEHLSGTKVASSTLPNRLKRIEAKVGIFSEEEDLLLRRCQEKLESTFEQEKWGMLQEMMVAKGARKIPSVALKDRAQKLRKDDEEAGISN